MTRFDRSLKKLEDLHYISNGSIGIKNVIDMLHDIRRDAFIATIGSCTCCTKTNEKEYHDKSCRYRLLMNIYDGEDV